MLLNLCFKLHSRKKKEEKNVSLLACWKQSLSRTPLSISVRDKERSLSADQTYLALITSYSSVAPELGPWGYIIKSTSLLIKDKQNKH